MDPTKIIGYEFYRDYYADADNRQVLRRGEPLPNPLTPKEFEVLEFFLAHPRVTIRREDVTPLNDVPRDYSSRHPIDDYIKKIRSKLSVALDELFVGVRKVGYRFNCDVRPIFDRDREEAGGLYKSAEMHLNEHTTISMRATVQDCLQAIAVDPHGPPGTYIFLAYAYINLGHVGYCSELPDETMPKAKQAAEAALAEDPKSGEAYGVLGLIALIWEYALGKAEALLDKAIALDPKEVSSLLSHAHLAIIKGESAKGLEFIERAVKVDPTDKIMHSSWGWLHLLAGDTSRAKELMDKAVFRFPEFGKSHFLRSLVYEACQEYDEALKSIQNSLKLEVTSVAVAALGHLHGVMGKPKLALSTLRDLSRLHQTGEIAYLSGYCEALIYVGLGETERCLAALEKAYEQRCDWLIHLGVEPRWLPVRNQPRFRKLMEKIGIKHLSQFSSEAAGIE